MEYHPGRRINKQIAFLSTVGEESGCMFLVWVFVGKILHHVFFAPFLAPHLMLPPSRRKNHLHPYTCVAMLPINSETTKSTWKKTVKSMGSEIWFHKTPPPPQKKRETLQRNKCQVLPCFFWGVGRGGTAAWFWIFIFFGGGAGIVVINFLLVVKFQPRPVQTVCTSRWIIVIPLYLKPPTWKTSCSSFPSTLPLKPATVA